MPSRWLKLHFFFFLNERAMCEKVVLSATGPKPQMGTEAIQRTSERTTPPATPATTGTAGTSCSLRLDDGAGPAALLTATTGA